METLGWHKTSLARKYAANLFTLKGSGLFTYINHYTTLKQECDRKEAIREGRTDILK